MEETKKPAIEIHTSNGKLTDILDDDYLVLLAEILEKIDETKPNSKINEYSISNNNGGRIYL